MQIQNNTAHRPSFRAIKSIKCTGIYKNEPELAKELVDTFKTNTEAMEFCKKYDVDIIFHAKQDTPADATESTLIINYVDPTKNKIKRFFDTLNGIKNNIKLHAWGTGFLENESLKNATEGLKELMYPKREGKPTTGVLKAHIEIADKDISKRLERKTKIIEEKEKTLRKEQQKIATQKTAALELEKSIKDLLNETN